MLRSSAAVLALMLAAPALAQAVPEVAGTAQPAPEASPPPSEPVPAVEPQLTPPPPPSEPWLPPAFNDQFVTVDQEGKATVGKQHRPITRLELFELAGRDDLIQKSASAAKWRLGLIIAGATVAVAGAATAVALFATLPDFSRAPCQGGKLGTPEMAYYRDVCLPQAELHTVGGTIGIIAGATLAGLAFTLAFWNDPDVLDRHETMALASKYNAALKKRLLQAPPASFLLVPVIGPGGGGLVARLTLP